MTVSAFRSKKTPVPLLAPTYSFTGKDWWTPLMQAWDKMKELEKFKGVDYMIPTLSKDSTGVIARPSAADRALRNWGTSDPSLLANLTWHSFRVFVPDCAYQLGFPRSASIPGELDIRDHCRHLHHAEGRGGQDGDPEVGPHK